MELHFAKTVKILICKQTASFRIHTTNFYFPYQYFQMTLNKTRSLQNHFKMKVITIWHVPLQQSRAIWVNETVYLHSQLKDIVNFFNGSSGRKPDSPFTTPSTAFSHILAKQWFPTLLVKCIKFCMVDFHQNFSIESRIFRFFSNHKNCRD